MNDAAATGSDDVVPANSDNAGQEPKTPRSRFQRIRRFISSSAKWLFRVAVAYLLIVLVGFIPVNNDFKPSGKGERIRIYVQSSEVHADFIVPIKTDVIDWSETALFDNVPDSFVTARWDHVAIGWGDRGFYLHTPTWSDLSVAKVANAMLLPSQSVMHLSIAGPSESANCKSVVISTEQYKTLVRYIQQSFSQANATPNEAFAPVPIPEEDVHPAWSKNNFFFAGTGSYHVFNTCNCWVGNGLKKVGVRTAWFTPLPKTVFLHWPK